MTLTVKSDIGKVFKLVHPCRCPKCENSCNYGSGALVGDDLKNIAEFLGKTEEQVKEDYMEEIMKFNTKRLKPKLERQDGKPYGKCIFYEKDQGCSIHPVKPLECKIAMGCKPYGEELITWFMLNHYLDENDPESIRQYKLYLDSGGKTLPGAELANLVSEEELKKILAYDDLKDQKDWDKELGIK